MPNPHANKAKALIEKAMSYPEYRSLRRVQVIAALPMSVPWTKNYFWHAALAWLDIHNERNRHEFKRVS